MVRTAYSLDGSAMVPHCATLFSRQLTMIVIIDMVKHCATLFSRQLTMIVFIDMVFHCASLFLDSYNNQIIIDSVSCYGLLLTFLIDNVHFRDCDSMYFILDITVLFILLYCVFV